MFFTGIADPKTGIIHDQEKEVGSSSNSGWIAENISPTTASVAMRMVALDESTSQINGYAHENPSFPMSLASFFRELWATLVSYAKSPTQFSIYVAMAVIVILILLQVSSHI